MRRTKEGGDRDCQIVPLQVQAGLASRCVFTWLSHADDEGGRRPRLSNSTAVTDDGMMTSVSRGAIFVNAEDITIECDVEWHPQGGDVEWHPQGVSHVASSAVSFTAIRHSILYLEGSHDPDTMSEVVLRIEPFECCCMVMLFVGGRGTVSKR